MKTELGFSLRLLALAVPIGLAFFVLFPRLATPLWGIPETTLDSKSGLSDSMSPGSIQQLFTDDSPAFRVTVEGAVPPPDERYWRGPSWLIVNYMVADGLQRDGHADTAQRIIDDSVELIKVGGFSEYYDPLSGAPCGGGTFTWTAAMVIEFLTQAKQVA